MKERGRGKKESEFKEINNRGEGCGEDSQREGKKEAFKEEEEGMESEL